MSEHNLILEFYKPTYNLDFDYDGDGGLDLHFTNIKGEFFMTMNDSYNSVYIEDEDCEFSKGEMFATVDLGDLVERIINGEFRQTDGKAISDWGKRFIGDGEEQIEFNGKNYADGSLFWDDFFKEMSKGEIKDFMRFCEDYLYLPNIEVDTVSDKYDFANGDVKLKSNSKWGITINDDYTIVSVDEFTCKSVDAFVAYDVASSESDEDDFYESKKCARKSLKENELFSSSTPYEIKVNGKKIKSHSDYEVVYDKVENDEYVLGIKIKGVGNTQLRFSSKNEAKVLGWITESKKSARKGLKESTDEDFSLYDLNKHDPFVKEWIRNINKKLADVSIESIGDDEIVFRVWVDESMDLDVFDDIVTSCMPRLLIKFMSDMNIDFNYQFVYEDDKFIENDYVFIRFVAW